MLDPAHQIQPGKHFEEISTSKLFDSALTQDCQARSLRLPAGLYLERPCHHRLTPARNHCDIGLSAAT